VALVIDLTPHVGIGLVAKIHSASFKAITVSTEKVRALGWEKALASESQLPGGSRFLDLGDYRWRAGNVIVSGGVEHRHPMREGRQHSEILREHPTITETTKDRARCRHNEHLAARLDLEHPIGDESTLAADDPRLIEPEPLPGNLLEGTERLNERNQRRPNGLSVIKRSGDVEIVRKWTAQH
jgi:hypothetical protein